MTATSVRAGNCHAAPGLSKAFAAPGRRRAGDVGVRGRPVHGMSSMKLRAQPPAAFPGTATVPGDKSVSPRCLMFAALASGTSRISGLLEGEDVLATAGALRAMGVDLAREPDGGWRVEGRGGNGLAEPGGVLHLGNAGTGARLLMGLLAGQPFTSVLSGDASLRRRPMRRVTEPLGLMGAAFAGRSGGRLPLAVTGRRPLRAIDYASPVASAQVKSAVLLAGLFADGTTTVREPLPSRDHTERMLRAMGAEVAVEDLPDAARAASPPPRRPPRALAGPPGRGGRGGGPAGRPPPPLGPGGGVAGGAGPRGAGCPVAGPLPARRAPDPPRLRAAPRGGPHHPL